MTTAALILAAFAIIAALHYRQEMIAMTTFAEQSRISFRWQCQQIERERDRHANEGREAWEAYLKAFRRMRKSESARAAAEDHVKYLRAQLDEAKARAEAAERSQADTESTSKKPEPPKKPEPFRLKTDLESSKRILLEGIGEFPEDW